MTKVARTLCALGLLLATAPQSAVQAASVEATTVYAAPNCYIFRTASGHSLFERSGGEELAEGQEVKGALEDFGYQEVYGSDGAELMVGWIQDFGITDEAALDKFKKVCR